MKYYFISGDDIGYLDMGLFGNKYTALIFAKDIARKANNGKTYHLHNSDAICLAHIKARPAARHAWTNNIDN